MRLAGWLVCLVLTPASLPAPLTPCSKEKVDAVAIHEVESVYPGSGLIVTAIRIHENGPIGYDCGNDGQTKFAHRYPFHQRNYIECARSVSRFTTEWGLMGGICKDGKWRPYFDYLGQRYLNSTKARNRAWARSVKAIYLQLIADKEHHRGQANP